MVGDTELGREFPDTTWGAIARGGMSPDARRASMQRLAQTWWRPVYSRLRRWHSRSNHDAADLTQEFFLTIFETTTVEDYDPARGRFRNFLKAKLARWLAKRDRDAATARRRAPTIALEAFDAEPAGPAESPDADFDSNWRKAAIDHAIDATRAQLKLHKTPHRLAVFERYDVAEANGQTPPTLAQLAEELGITADQAHAHQRAAREIMRDKLRNILRETVSNPADLDDEFRFVLGA